MGMAASQARFLGLTARKTNTEYEGQQINQQRTMLANKSANYYNDLLGMTVPVPPSVDDYTKTVYTFSDGALENRINSLIAQPNGEYIMSYTRTWTNDNAIVAAASSIITRVEIGSTEPPTYTYMVGAKELRKAGEALDTFIANDEYLKTLTAPQIADLMAEESLYAEMMEDKYGIPAEQCYIMYKFDSTSQDWIPMFYDRRALENANYSENGSSQSFIQAYTVGTEIERNQIDNVEGVRLEKDASGRYINVSLPIPDTDPVQYTTYALTTNTTTDQEAYEAAHNQYEYDKATYEKAIQDINSKIEIIQAEDRSLELRLKQLDTERTAIQTEMESVQKVIEKNTQETFKIFNS
jgi:hypothetical protein